MTFTQVHYFSKTANDNTMMMMTRSNLIILLYIKCLRSAQFSYLFCLRKSLISQTHYFLDELPWTNSNGWSSHRFKHYSMHWSVHSAHCTQLTGLACRTNVYHVKAEQMIENMWFSRTLSIEGKMRTKYSSLIYELNLTNFLRVLVLAPDCCADCKEVLLVKVR